MRDAKLTIEWVWPMLVAGTGVFADLATKAWARAALAEGDVELFAWLSLRLRYNAGTTLGILAGGAGLWVTVLAVAVVIVTSFATQKSSKRAATAAALLVAGAAGNAIDRLPTGMVTDFVALCWGSWQAPIFNLADVLIVTGAALLVLPGLPSRTKDLS
jgi:signal peptidase II